jgi:hypothetical protein
MRLLKLPNLYFCGIVATIQIKYLRQPSYFENVGRETHV